MSMFEDIPVDVGIIYEGERIRWPDALAEFGGPKEEKKFELVRVRSLDKVEDGKITVIGPDISDLEKKSYPFGIYIEVAGKELEEELEGVVERRIHEYCNYIEGLMHLNQRYDIWLRLSKRSFDKGLNSFTYIGKVLQRLFKAELPIIEKIQVTFLTDPEKVKERYEEAMKAYEKRDARARGLKDEDVDAFYGCSLCQSFAPTHVCVITPQRYSNCGAISWFDGRAAARVDPKGPVFRIEKGECLDPVRGEHTGANEAVNAKSGGEISRVWLYSAFGYPHTSCGCFEAVAFYVPEVDGFGIVHRGFQGTAPNGLPFTTLADSTAGGRQVNGFHGVSVEYVRSPKFLQTDGGWNRVVWVPETLKERIKGFVPAEILDKVATDKEANNTEELKTFLEKMGHPVTERWRAIPVPAVAEKPPERGRFEEKIVAQQPAMVSAVPLGMESWGGGFKIILKNVKINAKKLKIRSKEK